MESINCALCVQPAMVLSPAGTSHRLLGKENHDCRGGSQHSGVKAGRRPSRQRRVAAFTPRSDPHLKMVRIRADVMTFEP